MLPPPLQRARVLASVIAGLGAFAFVMTAIAPEAVSSGTDGQKVVGGITLAFTAAGAIGLTRVRAWGYWSLVAAVTCLLPQILVGGAGFLALAVDTVLAVWLYQGRSFVRDRTTSSPTASNGILT